MVNPALPNRKILLYVVLLCAAGTDAQEEALLLLKSSLDPTATALPSWDPSTSPCQWQGITCNPAGQVTNMCASPILAIILLVHQSAGSFF